MSPDNVDSFILALADHIEGNYSDFDFNDDHLYDKLSDFVYAQLERFITKDRNYN